MPTEARDQGLKELDTNPQQDHISAKRMNSIEHYSLVHKFIPMPRAFTIPDAKAAVKKTLGKN